MTVRRYQDTCSILASPCRRLPFHPTSLSHRFVLHVHFEIKSFPKRSLLTSRAAHRFGSATAAAEARPPRDLGRLVCTGANVHSELRIRSLVCSKLDPANLVQCRFDMGEHRPPSVRTLAQATDPSGGIGPNRRSQIYSRSLKCSTSDVANLDLGTWNTAGDKGPPAVLVPALVATARA